MSGQHSCTVHVCVYVFVSKTKQKTHTQNKNKEKQEANQRLKQKTINHGGPKQQNKILAIVLKFLHIPNECEWDGYAKYLKCGWGEVKEEKRSESRLPDAPSGIQNTHNTHTHTHACSEGCPCLHSISLALSLSLVFAYVWGPLVLCAPHFSRLPLLQLPVLRVLLMPLLFISPHTTIPMLFPHTHSVSDLPFVTDPRFYDFVRPTCPHTPHSLFQFFISFFRWLSVKCVWKRRG